MPILLHGLSAVSKGARSFSFSFTVPIFPVPARRSSDDTAIFPHIVLKSRSPFFSVPPRTRMLDFYVSATRFAYSRGKGVLTAPPVFPPFSLFGAHTMTSPCTSRHHFLLKDRFSLCLVFCSTGRLSSPPMISLRIKLLWFPPAPPWRNSYLDSTARENRNQRPSSNLECYRERLAHPRLSIPTTKELFQDHHRVWPLRTLMCHFPDGFLLQPSDLP